MTAIRDLSRLVLKRYEETSHDKNQIFQKDGLWSGNIHISMWINILNWVYISDLISSIFMAYLLYATEKAMAPHSSTLAWKIL